MGDRVTDTRQQRDETPEVVLAASINEQNRKYWSQPGVQREQWSSQQQPQGGPSAAAPGPAQPGYLRESITAAELASRNTVPSIWRSVLDGTRVGRLVAKLSRDAIATLTVADSGRQVLLDGQVPRGRRILTLAGNRFVVEESDGNFVIWDFGLASDPEADPVLQSIARFEAELAEAGSTLSGPGEDRRKVAATDRGLNDVSRIQALARRLAGHDWSRHGR